MGDQSNYVVNKLPKNCYSCPKSWPYRVTRTYCQVDGKAGLKVHNCTDSRHPNCLLIENSETVRLRQQVEQLKRQNEQLLGIEIYESAKDLLRFVYQGLTKSQTKHLEKGTYLILDNGNHIGTLECYKQKGVFSYIQIAEDYPITASQLREIADKLDELNGEVKS